MNKLHKILLNKDFNKMIKKFEKFMKNNINLLK
jgi:hypothetical protein